MNWFHHTWYGWSLIVFVYIVIGMATGALFSAMCHYKFSAIDIEEAVKTGSFAIFWPVTLPLALLVTGFMVFGGAAACIGALVRERVEQAKAAKK